MISRWKLLIVLLVPVLFFVPASGMFGQLDQGTITGIVEDPSGAVIANANVTLTNVDMGLVLRTTTDASGIYVFSPIKIGSYQVSASAAGFETTTQTNLHLNIQQRLNVVISLKPGAANVTVTVTTELPLMQTQDSSVGQTMTAETINNVPLSGRNWVYIAQLAPGTDLPAGSRGAGNGDFVANGQRAEENNFILDGVDNNANVVDYYNGASYVVNPPPDALEEFKVQTSNYSAEFGHSVGAVVNASIKSGTNNFHGSLWEYVRNNDLGEATTPEWAGGNGTVPPYHQNMFGATLGGPVMKNKIFLFADTQANRIVYNSTALLSVPSANERKGDFSELLNPVLIGQSSPVQLYYQDPTSASAPVAINNNCLAAGTSNCPASGSPVPLALDSGALKILSEYPSPNVGNGNLYNNYSETLPIIDNTFQWDVRADWNIGSHDTTYSRYSYHNEMGDITPPLGPILDGGTIFAGDGTQKNYGANFMWSETHSFTPTFINEARFGINYLHDGFTQPNAGNAGFASSQGFGGIPGGQQNGGLPEVSFGGAAAPAMFGSPTWAVTDEHNNVYQIIDNITKIAGNHALKGGVDYQNIRFSTLQPQESRGTYYYSGGGTSVPGISNTGYGLADFLLNEMNFANLSNEVTNDDQEANLAFYFQDDWRLSRKLTVNLGLRYEHFEPYQDVGGYQASFNYTSKPTLNTTTGLGSVTGQYVIPSEAETFAKSVISPNGFDTALAADGMKIVYDSDPRLRSSQKLNFAPRIGAAWSFDDKTVIRAGVGIFYGGLEGEGYWPNLGENYPFQYSASFYSAGCTSNYCPNLATNPNYNLTIANGYSTILKNGFASVVTGLNPRGADPAAQTSYTESWNLSVERSIMKDMVGTVSYVGNTTRHLPVILDINMPLAIENPSNNTNPTKPMPDYGSSTFLHNGGMSDYNGLQTKLEKRMAHGYSLLASYTWSHALDDAIRPLGSTGQGGGGSYPQTNLIPMKYEYSNSNYDTRQRFTLNGLYDLPFGKGRAYVNNNTALDYLVGGWSADATFVAQTGQYFTVGGSSFSAAGGFDGTQAVRVKGEFATGGSDSNCASQVKTRAHWFNPCSYANPWDAGDPYIVISSNGSPLGASSSTPNAVTNPHYIPKSTTDPNTPAGDTTPVYVTDLPSVLSYDGGQVGNAVGPGYERVNMSAFKDFTIYREQKLSFRADVFNLLNTPSWGTPNGNNSSTGGLITSTLSLQKNAPDPRFFQLSLKYAF